MSRRRPATAVLASLGCYSPATGGRGRGVTIARLAPDRIDLLAVIDAPSPSFLAWAPDGHVVYAAHETSTGSVGAYRYGRNRLTPLGDVPSEGARPCHVVVHPSGRFLACANYGGGTFTTIQIRDDGTLGPTTGVIAHHGTGPDPTRQNLPHPHQVAFTPDGDTALLTDISLDTVSVHPVDALARRIAPQPRQVLRLPRGSGPRHLARLADGTLVMVHELDATVSVLRWSEGRLMIQATRHPTTADGGPGAWPSEITPFGPDRFLIGNRRTGSLSIHRLALARDGLTQEREIPIPPANVRHLAVVDGTAYVALQDTDMIAAIDLGTGRTTATAATGSPACVAPRPITGHA
ncbi:lactonase family protein [Actinoallomurus iriomotensis]|uniref:Uncharacterized protein n=1 Tax=Actinoallomurus iriomotensis TaxID=478107 RepID=A0A9W6S4C6_9ACTN|nr:beta-propeller fold lactonase family protein [Actinoallomurus iriomotensis]GLY87990.1 hypothetical protein Airi02_059190 [Actinoallomurus iriomotensis]